MKCPVCRCSNVYSGDNPAGCGIAVRVYVNTVGQVEGISPPCPAANFDSTELVIVDAWCLFGSIDMGKAFEPTGELYERQLAIDHADLLGYRNQNVWAVGVWEDAESHHEGNNPCDVEHADTI